LDALVKGEVVQGRPLVVRRLNIGDDLEGCQVLFISRGAKDQMPALLQKLKGSPVLTVADSDGFTDLGGMVNFVLVEEKVKFEINQTAADQCGLQISAKLLKIARVVKGSTP
jgi:hypothetical protein